MKVARKTFSKSGSRAPGTGGEKLANTPGSYNGDGVLGFRYRLRERDIALAGRYRSSVCRLSSQWGDGHPESALSVPRDLGIIGGQP